MWHMISLCRRFAVGWGLCLLSAWLCGVCLPGGARAREAPQPVATPGDALPLMVPQIKTPPEADHLEKTVADAIKAEKQSVARLEAQIESVEAFQKTMATQINGYHLQLTAHANLLASQEAGIEAIEKARTTHQNTLIQIDHQRADVAQRQEAVRQRLEGAEGQYDLNQEQLTDINAESADPARTQAMVEQLQELIRLLSAKINLLETISGIYGNTLASLEELQQSFSQLAPKFEEVLQLKRKEVLFERKGLPLFELTGDRIQSAMAEIRSRVGDLFTRTYWADQFRGIYDIHLLLALSFVFVLAVVEYLLLRLRRYCRYLDATYHLSQRYPWRHFTLTLFQRSLLLSGLMAFVFAHAKIRGFYDNVPFSQAVVHTLFILLCCRWGYDFIHLWNERRDNKIPERLMRQLRLLIGILAAFAVGYTVLAWLLGEFNVLLSFARILFLLTVLVWGGFFWSVFRDVDPDAARIGRLTSLFRRRPPAPDASAESETSRIGRAIKTALIGAGDVIWIGALLLEVTGYGSLAMFWLVSWGLTAVLGLWIILAYKMLREWGKTAKAAPKPLDAEPSATVRASVPLRWLLQKLCWIAWGVGLVLALIVAWGADQQVLVGLIKLAQHPFTLGGLNLSVMGLFNVVLILLVIHALTRIWRSFLLYQVLADSGLESGVKHSITVITVYLIWALGIIMALNALGVSTTSLAVAFGALSIGLGFGLQNIFSNFISGIILLFERPIQVGDAVEVNGVWGEVTRINVRSTVVKTYDNAALIIPNSDFISSQVTNWSFKDLRVRRIISVGVAYGSDIERVREILLAIPDGIPHVLKYPRPVVLFTNFGESSLDFQLRIWTDINNMLVVDSHIRFEIDRRFREEGIQIPFPQRDVHLTPPPTPSPERRGGDE